MKSSKDRDLHSVHPADSQSTDISSRSSDDSSIQSDGSEDGQDFGEDLFACLFCPIANIAEFREMQEAVQHMLAAHGIDFWRLRKRAGKCSL